MHPLIPAPSSMAALIWLIPVVSAISATILMVGNRKLSKVGPYIGTAVSLLTAVMATINFLSLAPLQAENRIYETAVASWLSIGDMIIDWSFLVDPLSSILLMLITWVGLLVHIYSLGYMHDDENIARYFGYLNLFVGSMAILVLGSYLPVLFVGWELVGLCSFLLIGFWYHNKDFAAAAKKAFVVNRIGDAAFLIGMFMIFRELGTLHIPSIINRAAQVDMETLAAICGLLFIGATAKSAQIPLFIWLPDAMAGPTPVSALIHAATMVTAGVYLIARLSIPFAQSGVLPYVMVVGALTAFMAATIACFTNEYKQILAWSTISQLGYMMISAGAGDHVASTFHLLTHGFFKAALFLAAGSVMHAMANSTDIRRMGGLLKVMPITAGVSLVGVLAISGFPLMSGFFSKEEVLVAAANAGGAGPIVWVLGIITALLTAFYMTRWFVLIFLGEARWEEGVHPHESPQSMTIPMSLLAVASVIGGALNATGWLHEWLHESVAPFESHEHFLPHWVMMGTAIGVAFLGIGLGYLLNRKPNPAKMTNAGGLLGDVVRNGYFYNEGYERLTSQVAKPVSQAISGANRKGLDALVQSFGPGVSALSSTVRRIQNGRLRSYSGGILAGILIMLAIVALAVVGG